MFSGKRTLVIASAFCSAQALNEKRDITRRIYRTKQFIINAILLLTMSTLFGATVFAQSDNVLVAGDPQFAQSDFEAVVKFYERGLDIKFSDDERGKLQSKITATWRKNQKSNGGNLAGFMKNVEKFNTIDDRKIRENQREFADALLADLKAMAQNGWSEFVIDVYENARRGDSTNAEQQEREETSTQTETQTIERAETETGETSSSSDQPNFRPVSGHHKNVGSGRQME